MDGQVPYLLSELSDVTSTISYPLQCTQRIKYTCFDVSKTLLVFGATSGGLYVFNRDPCSFVQLIPNKEGTVTQLKISPDEKSVSFATARGIVCVCDCGPAGSSYVKSPRLQTSKQHQGNEVTSMVWSCVANQIYIGDDTGRISVLYLSNFIAKNVFQTTEFTLMSLDSRIVQLDIRETMLLASTMTRCYICDTVKEQYKQIGQKLRDGEFGGCFFYSVNEDLFSSHPVSVTGNGETHREKVFNAIPDNDRTENYDKFNYIKIFSARPGSRLWEVRIDGTVSCTHQFKQLLAIPPTKVVTLTNFENENFEISSIDNESFSPQSFNFSKVFMLANKFIFTFKKDGIYIFDPKKLGVVLWSDKYSNIVDCKIIDGHIYLWLGNGNIITLSFSTVEKFLLKCFVNQKYKLCAQVCALHVASIINAIPSSKKIHLISELGERLQECSENELYDRISPVLNEICKIKRSNGQKLKSGIFVVDNSYYAKSASQDGDSDQFDDTNVESPSKTSSDESDSMLFQISPDAIQVIKGISNTVSEKLSSGTKNLKKTWDHFEDKMKNIGAENAYCEPLDVRTGCIDESKVALETCISNGSEESEEDIIIMNKICRHDMKQSSTSPPKQTVPEANKIVKSIYHHIKLSDINKLDNSDTIYSLISDTVCDINDIYKLVKDIEMFMVSAGDTVKYSKMQSGKILLQYISKTPDISETLDRVIENDEICSYFLQAFINNNSTAEQILSCECGYPLPKSFSSQMPTFSDVIDVFVEKRWNSSQSEQCYDICKKVPFMWRKILYLRKNEDLLNLLLLILQMLDEELLYSFLPQFTVVTWEKAVKLFGTLKNNECLNCGRKFEWSHIAASETDRMLSWDCIGALMIKSVGCQNAIKIMKTYADLIPNGELTLKFYHTCIFLKLFEKYDGTVMTSLIDTIYEAYKYEDALFELNKHLSICLNECLPHTALPLAVASKSPHWGLKIIMPKSKIHIPELEISIPIQPDLLRNLTEHDNLSTNPLRKGPKYEIGMTAEETLNCLDEICPNNLCNHCCLPLDSRVLFADGGLWVFSCGHTYHGVCLTILKIKLCSLCFKAR